LRYEVSDGTAEFYPSVMGEAATGDGRDHSGCRTPA